MATLSLSFMEIEIREKENPTSLWGLKLDGCPSARLTQVSYDGQSPSPYVPVRRETGIAAGAGLTRSPLLSAGQPVSAALKTPRASRRDLTPSRAVPYTG